MNLFPSPATTAAVPGSSSPLGGAPSFVPTAEQIRKAKFRLKHYTSGKGKGRPMPPDLVAIKDYMDRQAAAPAPAPEPPAAPAGAPAPAAPARPGALAPVDPRVVALREKFAKALPAAPFNTMAALRDKQFGPGAGDFWKLKDAEEGAMGEAVKVAMELFFSETDVRWLALAGGGLVAVSAFLPRYMKDQAQFNPGKPKPGMSGRIEPARESDGERNRAGRGTQGERKNDLGEAGAVRESAPSGAGHPGGVSASGGVPGSDV